MRPTQFSADTVVALLRKQTVASLTDVMAAFGPRVSRRTAFRKLKDLHARTSYSHRGGYYTLDELADFDEHGLWTFAGVRFSRAGTLVATAEAFVNHAEAGHFVDELDNLLGVGTQDALRKLVGDGRLTRHKLAGHFLYCATDHAHQTHQLRARRLLMATPGLGRPLPDADLMPEELRAAIALFASLLDERQRRLFAGLESLKCGWGGDRRIATLLGIDPSTVATGRRQLVERDVEVDRVRRAGGGRTPTEKKTPDVFARLEALMAHETAGDPVSGLRRPVEADRNPPATAPDEAATAAAVTQLPVALLERPIPGESSGLTPAGKRARLVGIDAEADAVRSHRGSSLPHHGRTVDGVNVLIELQRAQPRRPLAHGRLGPPEPLGQVDQAVAAMLPVESGGQAHGDVLSRCPAAGHHGYSETTTPRRPGS